MLYRVFARNTQTMFHLRNAHRNCRLGGDIGISILCIQMDGHNLYDCGVWDQEDLDYAWWGGYWNNSNTDLIPVWEA